MREHRGLAVVAHDLGEDAAEETRHADGQAMSWLLGKRELDIEHAAVSQNHHEEAQPAGIAHGDHLPTAPVDLGAAGANDNVR